MRDDRRQLRMGDALSVTTRHVVSPRGVAHDEPHDVRRAYLVPDRLEGSASVVERARHAQGLHLLPEKRCDLVRRAGQHPLCVEVVPNVGVSTLCQKYPVLPLGILRLRPDGASLFDGGYGFRPEGNHAHHARLAPGELDTVRLHVQILQVGYVSVADATVEAEQKHRPQHLRFAGEHLLDLRRGVRPVARLGLRRPQRLLTRKVELRAESERPVDVLVLNRPLRKGADRADVSRDGVNLVLRHEVVSVLLPLPHGDVEHGRFGPKELDRHREPLFVPVVSAGFQLARLHLGELRIDEQLADVQQADVVVGGRGRRDQGRTVLAHLFVITLKGELRTVQGREPFHLPADLRNPPFAVGGKFHAGSPSGCGQVVVLVCHNRKIYVIALVSASSSVIILFMEQIANPLFVGSNPTSASAKKRENKGFEQHPPEQSDNRKIPDDTPTDGVSGCGAVVAEPDLATLITEYLSLQRRNGRTQHQVAADELHEMATIFAKLGRDISSVIQTLSAVPKAASLASGWAGCLSDVMRDTATECVLADFTPGDRGSFTANLRITNDIGEQHRLHLEFNGSRWILPHRLTLRELVERTGLSVQYFQGLCDASRMMSAAWLEVAEAKREYKIDYEQIREVVWDDHDRHRQNIHDGYRYGRHGVLKRWREESGPGPSNVPECMKGIEHLREYDLHAVAPCHVYFLLDGDEVVYVGQSMELSTRIEKHKEDKVFNRVLVIECDQRSLNRVEQMYIKRYTPKYNTTGNPKAKKKHRLPEVL